MTLQEAHDMVRGEPKFWTTFRAGIPAHKLELSKDRYRTAAARMVFYTFDAYVMGDGEKTRAEAWQDWMAWLHRNYNCEFRKGPNTYVADDVEYLGGEIFDSIDSVHAYT